MFDLISSTSRKNSSILLPSRVTATSSPPISSSSLWACKVLYIIIISLKSECCTYSSESCQPISWHVGVGLASHWQRDHIKAEKSKGDLFIGELKWTEVRHCLCDVWWRWRRRWCTCCWRLCVPTGLLSLYWLTDWLTVLQSNCTVSLSNTSLLQSRRNGWPPGQLTSDQTGSNVLLTGRPLGEEKQTLPSLVWLICWSTGDWLACDDSVPVCLSPPPFLSLSVFYFWALLSLGSIHHIISPATTSHITKHHQTTTRSSGQTKNHRFNFFSNQSKSSLLHKQGFAY